MLGSIVIQYIVLWCAMQLCYNSLLYIIILHNIVVYYIAIISFILQEYIVLDPLCSPNNSVVYEYTLE